MTRVTIDASWRVRAVGRVVLPLPAGEAWRLMRDWRRFLTDDPLHRSVAIVRSGPRPGSPAGTRIVIRHRVLGLGPDRIGRVLRWEEGRGYAVSDLSRRGPRRGFPHVCTYRLEPLGERECLLEFGARGLWTARWTPRWMARVWLWWVIAATAARCRTRFAMRARVARVG